MGLDNILRNVAHVKQELEEGLQTKTVVLITKGGSVKIAAARREVGPDRGKPPGSGFS